MKIVSFIYLVVAMGAFLGYSIDNADSIYLNDIDSTLTHTTRTANKIVVGILLILGAVLAGNRIADR